MRCSRNMTIVILSVMALVVGACFVNTVAHAKTTYKYAKTLVNVRKKPNVKSKSLGELFELQKVVVLDEIGKWTIIEYKNKVAYVMSKYLKHNRPKSVVKKCPVSGRFKSYMDYTCITSTGSPQYKLQHTKAYTDPKTGVRMVNGRYCVALGSGFCTKIGTKVDIILKNGRTIPAILSDQKKDSETAGGHKYHSWDGSVGEFLVSTRSLPKIVRRMGSLSYVYPFRGAIKAIRIYKG